MPHFLGHCDISQLWLGGLIPNLPKSSICSTFIFYILCEFMHETILQCINIDHNRLWLLQSIINKPSHRTTFLQSRLISSILPQTSYFFLWFFCLDVLFINMNFSRFLLHGENEMWQYTLLEAVAWSWRHSAQYSVAYFTKIISLLLHWMSHMLYTSPGRGQNKVARVQDLQGKRRKTRSSHTIISISALNTYNNANFDFSLVALRPVFSVVHGQGKYLP